VLKHEQTWNYETNGGENVCHKSGSMKHQRQSSLLAYSVMVSVFAF
jgi:hypothetical protein